MVDPIIFPIVIIVVSCVTGTTTTGLFLFRFIPWLKETLHDAIYDKIIVMRGDNIRLFAAILLAISKKSEALSKKCILSVTTNNEERQCHAPPVGEYVEMDDFCVTCVSRCGTDIDGLCIFYRTKNAGKVVRFIDSILNKTIPPLEPLPKALQEPLPESEPVIPLRDQEKTQLMTTLAENTDELNVLSSRINRRTTGKQNEV